MNQQPGIFDSVKALLQSVIAMVHNRVELLSTELQEELSRIIAVLVWSIAALLCTIVGLTFAAVLVLLSVDEPYRALASGIIAAIFLIGAGAAVLYVRELRKSRGRPFAASLSELETDYDGLREDA